MYGPLDVVRGQYGDTVLESCCFLVDNLIAKKLILPMFRLDAPVLLRVRVKLSHGTSQFISSL